METMLQLNARELGDLMVEGLTLKVRGQTQLTWNVFEQE